MKILISQLLSRFFEDEVYFEIISKKSILNSSGEIADFLNLDVDIYNNLLIDKVIRHDKYSIDPDGRDLVFCLKNVSIEIYIERFKETFINELTLATLGGETLDEDLPS